MRIALLTKRAKVKRDIANSAIEYLRQKLIAGREGKYGIFSSFVVLTAGFTMPALTSYSLSRD
jgi:hypothetical protein